MGPSVGNTDGEQVPVKPMDGESEEEWKQFKKAVQLKVVAVLRKWIQDQYDDFRNSDKLMKLRCDWNLRLAGIPRL